MKYALSRREFLRMAAIGVAGAAVVGCAPAPAPAAEGEAAGQAPGAAEVPLRYMLWEQNQVPAVEQQIAAFKERNPAIAIEIQLVPWDQYWDKLWTSLAGGGAPDTFWLNMANFKPLAYRGTLLSQQTYLDAQADLQTDWDTNFDALKAAYTYEGEAFSWPRDYDTIAIAVNLDLLAEAGLEYPSEENEFRAWDWPTIRSYAEQLTKQEGGRTSQFGLLARNTEQEGWFNWVYSNGGSYFNEDLTKCTINEPPAVEALREYAAYRIDGLSPGAEALQSQDSADMFFSGRIAMSISGSWDIGFFNERMTNFAYDLVPIPYAPTGQSICMIHGLGNTIDKNTQHPDEAFEWVSFLGSKDGSAILGNTGTVIPSRRDTADLWFDPSFPPPHRQIFLDWTDKSAFRPTTAEPASSEWQKILIDQMTLVMEQGKDVQQAMDEAAQQIDALLAGEGV
ncbi:MAG TPA: sugar ABC transporter substrate-binding protein [Caldilineaceae bacterium]|nr:sugar ABC transporter substrate-binding protein [Caldilineaceae bacterium]